MNTAKLRTRSEIRMTALDFAYRRTNRFRDLMGGKVNGGAIDIKIMAADEVGDQLARLSREQHIVEFHCDKISENPHLISEGKYLEFLAYLWRLYPQEVLKAQNEFE